MKRRSAFTLFELILAIALSAALMALIGTAINLYLVRMDTSRLRVEEAQLARSSLSTIAADLRAAGIYQTQDISSVEQIASQMTPLDPDSLDESGVFSGSGLGGSTPSGPGSPSTPSTPGTTGSGGTVTGLGGTGETDQASTTTAPGLNGLATEVLLDVTRLPRLDELFPAVPQQTSSTATATALVNVPKPSDAKIVRYFIRQGAVVDASDVATTSVSPQANLQVGGLVRQTVDRAVRETAIQSGNTQLLDSGQVLLAPEVTQLQFVYFNGTTAMDAWDMQQQGTMPTAVEVRIWIAPDPIEVETSTIPPQPRLYRQTVDLPLALASGAAASSSAGEEGGTDEETGDEEEENSQNPQLPNLDP